MHEPARIDDLFRALFAVRNGRRRAGHLAYPLDQLPAALEALGSRRSYGKVVVTP
jgi:hypothetical protein